MPDENVVQKYDRIRCGMQDVAMFTKPSTIKVVQTITGRSETFVVETCRYEGGDYVFIECVDESGVVRLALPPKVSAVISSQRDALTARNRSLAGKKRAAEMKAKGIEPGFLRGKKKTSK
jgi:hypothetical protein